MQYHGKATEWRPLLVAPNGGWRPRLKNPSLNPAITPPNTHEVHLGWKIPSLQSKSLLISKHSRLGRLKAVMKFDLKCTKSGIEKEFFGWPVCVKWPGVLGEHRKIGKRGRSSSYKKGRHGWMHKLPGHLSPSPLGRPTTSAPNWEIPATLV